MNQITNAEELIAKLEEQQKQIAEMQLRYAQQQEESKVLAMQVAYKSANEHQASGQAKLAEMAKQARALGGSLSLMGCLPTEAHASFNTTLAAFNERVDELVAASNLDPFAKQPELSRLLADRQSYMDKALNASITALELEVAQQDKQINEARLSNMAAHAEIRALLMSLSKSERMTMVSQSPEALAAVLAFGKNALVLGFSEDQLADLDARDIAQRLTEEQIEVRERCARVKKFQETNWQTLQQDAMYNIHMPAGKVKIFKGE